MGLEVGAAVTLDAVSENSLRWKWRTESWLPVPGLGAET